jgi:hypothetical protein
LSLALLTATLISAGCGGSRGRAPTKAQFIAAAEAICRREQAKLEQIAQRARERVRPPTAAELIRQRVAQSQLATQQLEDLRRPAGEGDAIKRWLTARTVAATVALDLAEAPPTGAGSATIDVAGELGRARARVRDLARRYGLGLCGELD